LEKIPLLLFDCVYLFIVLSTAVYVFIMYCAIFPYNDDNRNIMLIITVLYRGPLPVLLL